LILYLLRGGFLLLAAAVATLYVLPFQQEREVEFGTVMLMIGSALGCAFIVIALDAFLRKKKLSAVSGLFLGLIAGLVAAYALSFVVDLVGLLTAPEVPQQARQLSALEYSQLDATGQLRYDEQRAAFSDAVEQRDAYLKLLEGAKVFIGLITCYVAISLVLQTKDDFRFVIPYVEFTKQLRGSKPTLLDSSVIIDGRITDIIDTNFLQGTLVVPKFVLDELHTIADSADKLRRARGRRGLEILQQLQENPALDIVMDENDAPGSTTDQKLVSYAQQTQAHIMTNDYNLMKIANLRGVDVVNVNELAKALRPIVLPGEKMKVRIIKAGEGATQGVGYLEDGTMVVVEHARQSIGEEVDLVVTSSLQTSAGRMIFGKTTGNGSDANSEGSPSDESRQAKSSSGDRNARTGSRNPRRRSS